MESTVFDTAGFEAMRAGMAKEDEQRETMIKRSRDVLKLSKQAIYSLHRGETGKAQRTLAQAKAVAQEELLPIAAAHPHLRGGALAGALEEFAEAFIFHAYIETGKVPPMEALEIVSVEEYLGGVMDFTGELGRRAVIAATARDEDTVRRAALAVGDLQALLLHFDFRNGQLRRKYDGVKYTLQKLERIIYELSLTAGAGAAVDVTAGSRGAQGVEDSRQDDKRTRVDEAE